MGMKYGEKIAQPGHLFLEKNSEHVTNLHQKIKQWLK